MHIIFVLLAILAYLLPGLLLLMNTSLPPMLNNGQSLIDEESAFINARINKQTQLDISQTLSSGDSPPEAPKPAPDPLVKQPFVKPNGDISRQY